MKQEKSLSILYCTEATKKLMTVEIKSIKREKNDLKRSAKITITYSIYNWKVVSKKSF